MKMKKLIACIILAFASHAFSQEKTTVKPEKAKIASTKIKGTIVKSRVEKGVDASEILVMVATQNGNETIHLGPEWYIKNHSLTLQEGQTLEAHGWQSDMKGQRLFMAMDVEVGTWRMTLRDAYGRPMWRGGPKK